MAELYTRNGGLGTEMADHQGELHDYALRRRSLRVYEVIREDTGACYLVVVAGATLSCNCPAFKYRHRAARKAHRGSCKHCSCIRDVHQVLQTLTHGVPAHVSR